MKVAAFLVLVIGTVSPSYAADKGGEFFTRGVGSQTCAIYNAERSKGSPMYYFFRSWFNGYVSALNQVTPDTYDIVAGVNIDALSDSLDATCRIHPGQQFWTAASGVVKALEVRKLQNKTDVIVVDGESRSVMTTRGTIQAVQGALKEHGYYGGEIDGVFGPRTRAAIEAFQTSEELTITGLPDQETLSALFSKNE